MRKSLRKSLIYLIMTMLILPTWLVTGLLKAPQVKASGPTTLAEWKFNLESTFPDVDLLTNAVFSENSGGNSDYFDRSSSDKAYSSNHWNATEYYQLKFNTIGYKNINLSFSDLASPTGPTSFHLEYFNGVNYTVIPSSTSSITNSGSVFDNKSFNLTAVTQLNDGLDKRIRVVLDTDSSNPSGTWKIDDIKITADPMSALEVELQDLKVFVSLLNPNDYTAASFGVLNDAMALPETTNEEMIAKVAAIENAISGLVFADLTDLTAYNAALAKVTEADYTPLSWANYQVIVSENIVNITNTQEEIDAATLAITNAQKNLIFLGQANLDAAKASAASKVQGDYTQVSWTALVDALAMPETTNTEVVAKTKAINTAISNLVLEPAPVITSETAKSIGNTQATITWTTDHATNARVVYDTTSHVSFGSGSNYGYAFSSFTYNTTPTTLSHSIVITGLTPGTTYYFRAISQGSPTTVGPELSFKTTGTVPAPVATVKQTQASTSVAPSSAQAATTTTPTTTDNSNANVNANTNDDQGQIKGDETTTNDTEKINWTPWIVLFVLIVLAGAATGGYFYWFAGEDEVKAIVKEPKKVQSEKVVTSVKSKQSGQKTDKKSKRW